MYKYFSLSNQKILLFSVALLWFAAVFDPHGNIFYLRYISIILIFSLILFNLFVLNVVKISFHHFIYILIFSFYFPVYGIFIAFIRGGIYSDFIDTSYIAAGYLFLSSLIYCFIIDKNKLIFYILLSLRLLCSTIFIIYLSFFFQSDYLLSIINFFIESRSALISSRSYLSFELPYIYFFSTPMLFIYQAYCIFNLYIKFNIFNFLEFLFSTIALILSGTRANIILSLALPLIFSLLSYTTHYKFNKFAKFYLILIIFIAFYNFELLFSMFSLSEDSNSDKVGYISSYINIFNNFLTFLIGEGFNSFAWSPYTSLLISPGESRTELTYFEFLRVFGIINFLLFISCLFLSVYFNKFIPDNIKWLGPAIFCNFLVSFLNPYMFSTNGMLLFGLFISLINYKNKHNQSI